jgi:hypothetical protein
MTLTGTDLVRSQFEVTANGAVGQFETASAGPGEVVQSLPTAAVGSQTSCHMTPGPAMVPRIANPRRVRLQRPAGGYAAKNALESVQCYCFW